MNANAPVPSSHSPESYERLASPVLRSAWLLRACVLCGVAASALGVVVVPGLRSNASDPVVNAWERVSSVAGIGSAVLLAGLITTGAFDLSRTARIPMAPRVVILGFSAIALALGLAASVHDLPVFAIVPMMVATTAVSLMGAQVGLRAPHTRAPAIVLGGMALASVMRLVAWELANAGADRPSVFTAGRVFATIAVAIVGLSQMVAAAWMGARGRGLGQLVTAAALVGAFVLVWGAAKGAATEAPQWQAVLHTALKDAPSPQAFGVDALPAFLTVASMTLALATMLVRGQVVVVTSTLALAILGRGVLDVPMCSLATTASAVWIALAMGDDRAMWKDLVRAREDRLAQQ